MVDGFHWTRVTSKHLRFLYEEITQSPVPEHMRELAAATDRNLTVEMAAPVIVPAKPEDGRGAPPPSEDSDAALRNPSSHSDV